MADPQRAGLKHFFLAFATLPHAGARVNWHGAGNLLTASFPSTSNNTWTAFGKDHGAGYRDPATITVYAIAIYDPDNIWEVKVFVQLLPPKVKDGSVRTYLSNPVM